MITVGSAIKINAPLRVINRNVDAMAKKITIVLDKSGILMDCTSSSFKFA